MIARASEAGVSLEGFSVSSLLYRASCFKSVAHTQFLSNRAFAPME